MGWLSNSIGSLAAEPQLKSKEEDILFSRGLGNKVQRYRTLEVLLQSSSYGSVVDMWAMGDIMAELFTLRPLFPRSSEEDEIYKTCSIIGSPNNQSWSEGLRLVDSIKYRFL
ncbi:hypothetical protein SUGI_0719150 [Cryptomeria japonica]|nr:hypothetical protein SUGI_0719150 [Cryptomeria japonica]